LLWLTCRALWFPTKHESDFFIKPVKALFTSVFSRSTSAYYSFLSVFLFCFRRFGIEFLFPKPDFWLPALNFANYRLSCDNLVGVPIKWLVFRISVQVFSGLHAN
jgi:hypothetical protein